MKKVSKLSLVAAVATLGLTTVNAQSLEEAIKNVEFSGTAGYRYNNYKDNRTSQEKADGVLSAIDGGENNYKVALNLSSKLDDNFKFNTRTIIGTANGTFDKVTMNAKTQGDAGASVSLSQANFEFTGIDGTSIKLGKQAIVSPYAVAEDSLGNEQTGTGASANVTAGPVFVSAAYFNQINNNDVIGMRKVYNEKTQSYDDVNTNAGQNAATASVGVNFDWMSADVSYLGIFKDTKNNDFHVVGLGASTQQEMGDARVGGEIRYSKGLNAGIEQSLLKASINGGYSIANLKVTYLHGGDKGAKISLDEDSAATVNGWATEASYKEKVRYFLTNVNFDVLSDFNIAFNYNNLKAVNDFNQSEYYAQLNYKLSKNLSSFLRYGNVDEKGKDLQTRGRLQVVYAF